MATTVSSQPKHRKWGKFLFFIFVVIVINGIVLLIKDKWAQTEPITTMDLLQELEETMEPVGRFAQPDQFAADIPVTEWLSYINYTSDKLASTTPEQIKYELFAKQFDIYQAVIKIVCSNNNEIYMGSGTNIDSAGFILTNMHVVEYSLNSRCIVGFSDPTTGLVYEAYWAKPIADNEYKTDHDLAVISVEEPVFDEDLNVYGFYETYLNGKFPYFEETDECLDTAPQLGAPVYVLGYPDLAGGGLTITDGLISSLYSTDDYLITSAKISAGNSGGLAVDKDGCFVGVPTATYFVNDEGDEIYGEVIDATYAYEFMEAVSDDIENYNKTLKENFV